MNAKSPSLIMHDTATKGAAAMGCSANQVNTPLKPEKKVSRKAFCCECGAPVPMVQSRGKFVHGVCRKHPEAKRVLETWCQKQFAALREAVEAVTDSPGRVYSGGDTYWSVLEARAAGRGITRFGGAR